jgi:hypothetical protein
MSYSTLMVSSTARYACGIFLLSDVLLTICVNQDVNGSDAVVAAMKQEHEAYKMKEFVPRVIAPGGKDGVIFVLSTFKVKHSGTWKTVTATGR